VPAVKYAPCPQARQDYSWGSGPGFAREIPLRVDGGQGQQKRFSARFQYVPDNVEIFAFEGCYRRFRLMRFIGFREISAQLKSQSLPPNSRITRRTASVIQGACQQF
jgi:hypothetical protein